MTPLSRAELVATATRFADDWGDPQAGVEHAAAAVLQHLAQERPGDLEVLRALAAAVAAREGTVGSASFAARRAHRTRAISVDLRDRLAALGSAPPTSAAGWLDWVREGLVATGNPRARAAGELLTELAGATGRAGPSSAAPAGAAPPVPFTTDLTARAAAGLLGPVVGREAELAVVLRVLLRRTKNHPVLIGAAGVGKTAIVELLALRIAGGEVPAALRGARILQLDLGELLAGTRYRGDLEQRLLQLVQGLHAQPERILLFVDEAHLLVGAGLSEGSPVDLGNLLKPQLARGELTLVGATTDQEYERGIRRDPALERRLHPILISEPTIAETVHILDGVRSGLEEHHGLTIPAGVVRRAVLLSAALLPGRAQPDKAIDFLDHACAHRSVLAGDHPATLGPDDLVAAAAAFHAASPETPDPRTVEVRRAVVALGQAMLSGRAATVRVQAGDGTDRAMLVTALEAELGEVAAATADDACARSVVVTGTAI